MGAEGAAVGAEVLAVAEAVAEAVDVCVAGGEADREMACLLVMRRGVGAATACSYHCGAMLGCHRIPSSSSPVCTTGAWTEIPGEAVGSRYWQSRQAHRRAAVQRDRSRGVPVWSPT